MRLKLLLKRGALLAAANWPLVLILFAAQTTFQGLLAVPVIGAAILVAVLLGGDLGNLLQGGMRDVFATIAAALTSEPFALAAFVVAFGIVLVGGSALMFLVKGGVVDVMLKADHRAGGIEREPLRLSVVRAGEAFSIDRFVAGCSRLFMRYLALGLVLMVAYAATAAAYLAFILYGYRWVTEGVPFLGWTAVAAVGTIVLFVWITAVNLIYLLLQIVTAAGAPTLWAAVRTSVGFMAAEIGELSRLFVVVFGMVVAAWLASALAWSGVGLIAFVPLVGLAVFPLQIAALLLRGLVFEYIGLTAMGAYASLYRHHRGAQAPGGGRETGAMAGAVADPRRA
ncbi:MAG: hypothetical protein AB7Q29_14430 [Vicinamibacterales bacterium]